MLDDERQRLKTSSLRARGDTATEHRVRIQRAVAGLVRGEDDPGAALDPALRPYVEAVARRAWAIEDEDVDALRDAGFSEAAIYEVTVSAAVAAGLERIALAEAALDEAALEEEGG